MNKSHSRIEILGLKGGKRTMLFYHTSPHDISHVAAI